MSRINVCIVGEEWSPQFRNSLTHIKQFVSSVSVISRDGSRSVAAECSARDIDFRAVNDGNGIAECCNDLIDTSSSDWLLWVEPGETLSQEGWQKLEEITAADSSGFPDAFAIEIVTPGVGQHRDVDAIVCDQIRLHQSRSPLRFRGDRVWRLGPSWVGESFAWLDITISQPPATPNAWQRAAATLQTASKPDDLSDHDGSDILLFDRAMISLNRKEFNEAIYLFAELANRSHGFDFGRQVHIALAEVLMRFCRWEDAMQTLTNGKLHYPSDSELLFKEGVCLQRIGQPQRAIGAFREAYRIRPRRRSFCPYQRRIAAYEARHNHGVVLAELQQDDGAEQHWREVLEVAPLHAPTWAALGDLLLRRGRLDEANSLIQSMKQYESLLGVTLTLQSQFHESQGDFNKSRCCLEQAIRYAHHDTTALREMFRFFTCRGPQDELKPVLEELLRIDGESAATLYNVGTVYLQRGATDEAIVALTSAIRLQADHGPAYHNLARAFRSQGRLAEAEQADAKARELRAEEANLKAASRFLLEA